MMPVMSFLPTPPVMSLMTALPFLLLLVGVSVAGVLLGTMTGLIPGLHVNTVSLIILVWYGMIAACLAWMAGVSDERLPILVAALIVSLSIAHTFHDFIPSTFLGVPDPDTALSVLPAHEMLLKGDGYRAVHLSALGSGMALVIGMVILIPYSLILGPATGGYDVLRTLILPVLLFLTGFMLLSDPAEILGSRLLGTMTASGIFVLSGVLGLVVLPLPSSSPVGLASTVLFPLFSGLFGLSSLLISLNDGSGESIPDQRISPPDTRLDTLRPALPGTIAGSVVGFLPGVSSAHATLFSMLGSREDGQPAWDSGEGGALGSLVSGRGAINDGEGEKDGASFNPTEKVIVTLGAVNTANAFFVFVALFLTGSARSGAAVAVQQVLPGTGWTGFLPRDLALLMIAVIVSGLVSFHTTILLGRTGSEWLPRIPYGMLLKGIILSICVLVLLFNGLPGMAILAVSTATGIIPQVVGVRRSHLMGVLLIPVMFFLW